MSKSRLVAKTVIRQEVAFATIMQERFIMFLLFAGDFYYPAGGWEDYIGRYDSVERAEALLSNIGCDWYHIVDLSTNQIVKQGCSK